MMPREYEEPLYTQTDRTGRDNEIKITHPSYAQISASHVSGGICLYGSEFMHQHYVTITVSRSEMNRHLSNDWPFARHELIELAMSEAQWAAFVSSMNRGQGVQCTLQHIDLKQVPQIPAPESKLDMFKREGTESAQRVLNDIDSIIADIQDSKLSQKQKDDLVRRLGNVRDASKSALSFVLSQFKEHMEATVQKARTEISAYAQNLLVKTGLGKLVGKENLKVLGYKEKDDD
jgi:hypothetical protein